MAAAHHTWLFKFKRTLIKLTENSVSEFPVPHFWCSLASGGERLLFWGAQTGTLPPPHGVLLTGAIPESV